MLNAATIPVQIPVELAHLVMSEREVCGKYLTVRKTGNRSHKMARQFGFYLLLKAEAPESGWIKNYTRQIPELSKNFGLSQRSFFTYIAHLENLGVASREGNDIRIVGWKELGNILEINTKKRITIQFKYDGTQQIHRWFAAVEIEANQETQAYMVWKKVNRNSAILNELLPLLIERGFDLERLNNPEYFAGRMMDLYMENFRTGTEIHYILMNIRADVNRSCEAIGRAWDMSPQLVSYWKGKMEEQKILGVAKIRVLSEWTRATKECHLNPNCFVFWDDKLKERVWVLCDQLTVIKPWIWQEFLEKEAQKTTAIAA